MPRVLNSIARLLILAFLGDGLTTYMWDRPRRDGRLRQGRAAQRKAQEIQATRNGASGDLPVKPERPQGATNLGERRRQQKEEESGQRWT